MTRLLGIRPRHRRASGKCGIRVLPNTRRANRDGPSSGWFGKAGIICILFVYSVQRSVELEASAAATDGAVLVVP